MSVSDRTITTTVYVKGISYFPLDISGPRSLRVYEYERKYL